jgi:molecular chaperone IbpA
MNQLVHFDTAALNRALVGFDAIFNNFERRFANQINNNYPPHNVVKIDEENYEIHLAVTGFEPKEVSVELDQNTLVVKGEREDTDIADEQYIYRGLAARNFTRGFLLPEHFEVEDAQIKNGVLKVSLKHVVPEALKPRQIKVKSL